MSVAEMYPWHEQQWQLLSQSRRQGRLPHAILIEGVEGLGKSALARRFGMSLICPRPNDNGDACGSCSDCLQAGASSHPDLQLVVPEEPGKPIKIDAVRRLTARSVLAAQPDGYRVIIIDPADAMNRPAANALLKTLEEPSSRTVLVLVTAKPDQLPATIRSRCQAVKLPVPDGEISRQWLSTRVDPKDVQALLAIAGGAPIAAVRAVEEGWLAADRQLLADLDALRARKANPLRVVENWQQLPLTRVIDGFKRCLADMIRLVADPGAERAFHGEARAYLQTLGKDIDLKSLFALHDEVLRLERASVHNLNAQMLLERLANAWLQLTRRNRR
jgi:DNA polymerase-3 subunit delta'